MELNWTPEGIFEFGIATIILLAAIISYYEPKIKKIKPIFFIRFGIIFTSLLFYADGLAILFLNHIISRIESIFIVMALICFVIGINYLISESFNSVGLIIVCALGLLLLYLAILPDSVEIVDELGFLNVSWTGLFSIVGDLTQLVGGIILFYWGFKTWLNAPVLIKKQAFIFFLGLFIIGLGAEMIYLLYYLNNIFILVSELMMGIAALIFIIIIIKEPKILYILPFTLYRILVKDREGFLLYDHNWSESNINENVFNGFLNTVQVLSEKIMDIGGIVDINLENGILIFYESKLTTVGLLASKSSKLLRESLVQFTLDFEQKFGKELNKSIKKPSLYDGAFELIEKYFFNFPYKNIKNKKQPLLLTTKPIKIPINVENRLKNIFPNEKEYELIKTELLKSPLGFTSNFFTLYDDLKDERNKILEEKGKYLKDNSEKD